MASKTCWTVFGYFLTMLSIQTLVLFIAGGGMIPWAIPIGVPLGGKLTLVLNV